MLHVTTSLCLLGSLFPRDGFNLLGAPFGSSSFCTSSILRKVQKTQGALGSPKGLQDSDYTSAFVSSPTFALCACAPQLIQPAIITFDDCMRDALSDLAEGPLPKWFWLKALFHAPAAYMYIGSLQQSHSIMSSILGHPPATSLFLPGCSSALSEAAGRPEWLSLRY